MSRPSRPPAKLPSSPAKLPSSSVKSNNSPARLPNSRSPSKLPSVPKFVAKIHSHGSSPGHKHRVVLNAYLEATVKQIGDSLVNLDFDRFFAIFGPHTPVYQFIMELDFEAFKDSLSKAFPGKNMDSSNDQATIDAKNNLNEDLFAFDCMFKRMEDKGLNVGNIRRSLAWLRKRNDETMAKLPGPETKWFGKKSLELPNNAYPAFMPKIDPDEVTTLNYPVPKFDPARGWTQPVYQSHHETSKSGKTASKPLVDRNAADGEKYHYDPSATLPTIQGKDERPAFVTYVRSRSGGMPPSNFSPTPSRGSTHSRAHHDTPPAPVYYHHSVAPPSPPRRRECFPVSLTSERSYEPSYSHPHYHPQGYYEESDPNPPFIPPSPYSQSRDGHQSSGQRRY